MVSSKTAIWRWGTLSPLACGANCLSDGWRGVVARPALFVDRDGVINVRRPDHVKSWAEFEFLPGVLETLRYLKRAGIRVIVLTNQSVVGRGLLQREALIDIHWRLTATVAKAGGC